VTPALRHALAPVRALFLALALLCVLVQPVFSALHDLHEIEHVLLDGQADADPHGADVGPVDEPAPDSFDGVLHDLDCGLHCSVLVASALTWTPDVLRDAAPSARLAVVLPAPHARVLRPPIAS
jgi:hypothetical protein